MGTISKRNKTSVLLFAFLGLASFITSNIGFVIETGEVIGLIGALLYLLMLILNIYVVIGMSRQYKGVSNLF